MAAPLAGIANVSDEVTNRVPAPTIPATSATESTCAIFMVLSHCCFIPIAQAKLHLGEGMPAKELYASIPLLARGATAHAARGAPIRAAGAVTGRGTALGKLRTGAHRRDFGGRQQCRPLFSSGQRPCAVRVAPPNKGYKVDGGPTHADPQSGTLRRFLADGTSGAALTVPGRDRSDA
jgi:hypothetical protein